MQNRQWLAFIITILGCTNAADHDRQAVHDLVQDIIAADNRADIENVISCYHSDAILLPPGKQQIVGSDAIRKNYEAIFSSSVLTLTIREDELTIAGDYAICIGGTSGKVLSKKDSTTREVNDRFVMVLQKRDQVWKIKNLIWN
jgi:uncharacterized protein (TIGR02246 family)